MGAHQHSEIEGLNTLPFIRQNLIKDELDDPQININPGTRNLTSPGVDTPAHHEQLAPSSSFLRYNLTGYCGAGMTGLIRSSMKIPCQIMNTNNAHSRLL